MKLLNHVLLRKKMFKDKKKKTKLIRFTQNSEFKKWKYCLPFLFVLHRLIDINAEKACSTVGRRRQAYAYLLV